ncbi:hypothetical protein K8T06_02035 [bacterium]|nr:hypothetical protein [bacterium]
MKGIRITASILGVIIVFVAGAFVESYMRTLARKPIPVTIESTVTAQIEAYVQPDFLWIGESWWIKITADIPILLDVDGEWNALLPAGTNTLYSNHDVNNTTEFSSKRWRRTPSTITLKNMSKNYLDNIIISGHHNWHDSISS